MEIRMIATNTPKELIDSSSDAICTYDSNIIPQIKSKVCLKVLNRNTGIYGSVRCVVKELIYYPSVDFVNVFVIVMIIGFIAAWIPSKYILRKFLV